MKPERLLSLILVLGTALVLTTNRPIVAQSLEEASFSSTTAADSSPTAVSEIATAETPPSTLAVAFENREQWIENHQNCGDPSCQNHYRECSGCGTPGGVVGGFEFLLLRPHFSEAIAFAQGLQTGTSIDISGQELQFDYEGTVRAYVGYDFGNGDGELRFTYWRFRGDINVDGNAPGAGQFIVDPFGNVVGSVTVIDPNSALFGNTINGGALIQTRTIVETNVYDFEYLKPVLYDDGRWALSFSAGARIADIDQFYGSTILASNGSFFSGGDFSADFIGAGPRVGLECRHFLGQGRDFSVFAKTHGSLLVGEYDVRSTQRTTVPLFRATQVESLTRTIPVVETELGASWKINDHIDFSMGWLFQAWHDLGTSGGKFGGFFAGADDANNMTFDGLFMRGEVTF